MRVGIRNLEFAASLADSRKLRAVSSSRRGGARPPRRPPTRRALTLPLHSTLPNSCISSWQPWQP
jgi:hypothetical protein